MTAQEISDRLSQLADGLLFPSESEYPLEPFVWESTTLSSENILERSLQPSDTTIEAIALEDFFAPVVTDEDWFEDEDLEIANPLRDLQKAIATLENAQVFKVGKVEIDVYIVGAIGPDLIGLKTTVIET
ncbi:MAG: nuclease A inhibitor family protein [Pseudanabaena sp.]